jgi:hypothetical protein
MAAIPPIALPPLPAVALPHAPLNDIVNLPPAPANPPNHDNVDQLAKTSSMRMACHFFIVHEVPCYIIILRS